MKKFLVIGIYTDNFQRFADTVVADDWLDAMKQVALANHSGSLAIVEVVDEDLNCCSEGGFVESCGDISAGMAEEEL